LPQIHAPLDIMAWLASMQKSSATKFVLLPQGEQLLQQQTRPSGKIVLLIGAEGGFSAAEARRQCTTPDLFRCDSAHGYAR